MSLIRVDPAGLGVVAGELRASVQIAGQVQKHHDQLAAHAQAAGHPLVTRAIGEFLAAWAYGCGCLVGDGEEMARRLNEASRVYVYVEDTVHDGFAHTYPS